MSRIIPHRALEFSSGLELKRGVLSAYLEGDLQASAAVSDSSLDQILASYRVQEIFPELRFSGDGTQREIELTLEISFSLGSSIYGAALNGAERELWNAQHVGSNDFLDPNVPAGQRPWASAEKPGYGWKIELPSSLRHDSDPVVRQRAALVIESLISALARDEQVPMPYRRRFTNVFSAEHPTWTAAVPLVASGVEL